MFYFLLFFEGVIGLSYQLLFFRQAEPYVGYSSETTGWIIGIFLFTLSLGYKTGGRPHANPIKQLGVNFVKTALVGGVGASSVFLNFYFTQTIPAIGRVGALVLFCATVVAPIAYWMGQSLPLLIQSEKWGEQAAARGGNALFLSTLGSTAGAIGTPNGLFLILGASLTLLTVSMLALSVGGYLAFIYRKNVSNYLRKPARAMVFFCLSAIIFSVLISLSITPYFKGNPYLSSVYQDAVIFEKEKARFLSANQLIMSINSLENRNLAWYIDETARLMDFHKIESAEILVLGAGGFMLHRADKRKNNYLYVDIDSQLPKFVGEHFNPDALTLPFISEDARAFLIENPKKFEVIYLDTYSSRHALPRHLLTVEFFHLLKERLTSDGLLLINAIIDPAFNDAYSRNFHTTMTSVFPYCLGVAEMTVGNASNVIYHCQNKLMDKVIYTDNLNLAERDSISALGR